MDDPTIQEGRLVLGSPDTDDVEQLASFSVFRNLEAN